jgi:hypothetical protein
MPRDDTRSFTFDFGRIDWDAYESHRPPYPDALYDMIFQHHQNHGGDLDVALDVGAGGGTVTRVLLQRLNYALQRCS